MPTCTMRLPFFATTIWEWALSPFCGITASKSLGSSVNFALNCAMGFARLLTEFESDKVVDFFKKAILSHTYDEKFEAFCQHVNAMGLL